MVISDEDLKNIGKVSSSIKCSGAPMITFVGYFSSMDEAKERCKGELNPAIFMLEGNKTYIYFSEDRIEEYFSYDDYSFDKLKEIELINNMISYNIKEEFNTDKLKFILDNMKGYLELKNLSKYIRIDIIDGKPQFTFKHDLYLRMEKQQYEL